MFCQKNTFHKNFDLKKNRDFDVFLDQTFFSNPHKKFFRPPMQFIFSSEVVFDLPDCAQKKSWRYDKSVKKYSKKHHPPPRLGEGGGLDT